MSTANSVFSCLTCGKLLDGKNKAYKHILQEYGLRLVKELEKQFLSMEQHWT